MTTSKHVTGYAVTLVVGVVAGAVLAIATGVGDGKLTTEGASAITSVVTAVVPTPPPRSAENGSGTFRVPDEIAPGLYEVRATDIGGSVVWCSDLGCSVFNNDAMIGLEVLNPDDGTRLVRIGDDAVAVVLTDVELSPASE